MDAKNAFGGKEGKSSMINSAKNPFLPIAEHQGQVEGVVKREIMDANS